MTIDNVILLDKYPYAILVKQSDIGEWMYLKTEKPTTKLITGALYNIEFEISSKIWKDKFYTNLRLISITFSDDNL